MAWQKAPQAMIELFERIVPDDPRAERRKMFGYPCCFVNGNMFMGLHEDKLVVRLPADARKEFLRMGASKFEPFPGRVMKEYVVPPKIMLADDASLRVVTDRALAYGASLPPKVKKARKAKAKAKAS